MTTGSPVPDELLNQVVSVFDPRRVILFGSRARGDTHEDSDIDLVVELDDDAPPEMMTAKVIHSARKGYHEPVDILPCRESVLRERARATGSFAHTIFTEGVVIYERS